MRHLIIGFVAGCLVTTVLPGLATQVTTTGEQYRQIPTSYAKIIQDLESAFSQREWDEVGERLTEDFTWWGVGESGPKEVVRGRATTVEQLEKFFSSPNYIGGESEIHRLGMVGNTMAQVEVDPRRTGAGVVREATLHVYQYKDGKLWREFTFLPEGR